MTHLRFNASNIKINQEWNFSLRFLFQKLKCRLATCQVMSPNLCRRTTSKFITSRSSWTSSAKSNRAQTRYITSSCLINLLYKQFHQHAYSQHLRAKMFWRSISNSPTIPVQTRSYAQFLRCTFALRYAPVRSV
jgi:hypothetical protein